MTDETDRDDSLAARAAAWVPPWARTPEPAAVKFPEPSAPDAPQPPAEAAGAFDPVDDAEPDDRGDSDADGDAQYGDDEPADVTAAETVPDTQLPGAGTGADAAAGDPATGAWPDPEVVADVDVDRDAQIADDGPAAPASEVADESGAQRQESAGAVEHDARAESAPQDAADDWSHEAERVEAAVGSDEPETVAAGDWSDEPETVAADDWSGQPGSVEAAARDGSDGREAVAGIDWSDEPGRGEADGDAWPRGQETVADTDWSDEPEPVDAAVVEAAVEDVARGPQAVEVAPEAWSAVTQTDAVAQDGADEPSTVEVDAEEPLAWREALITDADAEPESDEPQSAQPASVQPTRVEVAESPDGGSVSVPAAAGSGEESGTTAQAAPVDLRPALEAILLVVDEPVNEQLLAQVLEQPTERIADLLVEIAAEYTELGRGFELRRAAGGWRLYTRPEYAAYVERFVLDGQSVRLTQAALETLAVVAYKQPVTRSRISAIRGVNCDGVLRTLVTRGLIEEAGIEQETGAHLFQTSSLFLEKLGLDALDQLPALAPFLPDNVDEIAGDLHR